MAIDNNKKLEFEIKVDDDLKSLGLEKVSIINKNVIINLSDGQTIFSKFKMDNLEGTLKSLNKKLINKGINRHTIDRLDLLLTDKILQKINESERQTEDNASATDIEKIKEEIEKDRISIGQISVEEWQAGIRERYQKLEKTVNTNLPSLWPGLEFVLSAKSILNIKGNTLPFAGILLGPPSSLKTVDIELFRKWPQTYYTDNFSAKSFVSHSTAVPKEQLEEIDMLPRIKDKLFLTPEPAPTFAARDDDLIQVLGIMTRILDGHGYESDTGAHGHRGYNERMMFVWVGAAVDIPRKVHKHLTTLGPKLYFLRLSRLTNKSEDDYYKQLGHDFEAKIKEIHKTLVEYLKYFEIGPHMTVENNGLPKASWNSIKDEEAAVRQIIKLGQLLARLRGVVPTWETQGTQGSDYAYHIPTIEEPDRAITQLRNLARGHALSKGRNYIASEDIPIVIKVVLSTASIERATIFDVLIANKGTLTTSKITTSLNITSHTAHRTMTELSALGLVDISSLTEQPNSEKKIELKPEYSWFLSEEFQRLREAFDSDGHNENNNLEQPTRKEETEHEEKAPLTSQKYENVTVVEEVRDDNGTEEHEDNQQLEENESMHKEKISSAIDDDNNSSNDGSNTDPKPKKLEIKFTPDYNEKEPIFWRVFEELSKKGNGLVNYDKLQERLVSTGKFFVGEAVLMIEHMEKIGKIEKTEHYNIYRIKESAPPK